ncbi:YopX family protein [Bacillus sp. BPN334]|uniref:YopX family protein n=1 Tax=Bacillus sp. BPN334 TaxID=2217815 RepID=UPI0011EDE039|nr:YopX family protein [Bacillus sp. BPN334]KAA0791731.1 hypothetical protein DN393_07870 [Bacillus sp. BPN334]
MKKNKFRAWHKEKKCWISLHNNGYSFNPNNGQIYYEGLNITSRIDLMQYTGLKDKNDKEIYEGDIVRIFVPHDPEEKEYVSKVYESDGAFVVDMVGYDIYMDVHCIGWIPGGYELEVIGNIYESLDLIKN